VKIEGAQHEYQNLDGVYDSVLDILLNIKQIRVAAHGDGPFTLRVDVRTAGEVTAAAIQCPEGVSVINSSQYITRLSEKASFVAELTVTRGVGYSPASDRSTEEKDVIVTDALYSPIHQVAWNVQNTRVGQRTDLDNLEITLETDGTLTAEEAFHYAASMTHYYFGLFQGIFLPEIIDEMVRKTLVGDPEEAISETEEPFTPIEMLALSPRTLNALINGGIDSIEKLESSTKKQLGDLKGFGKKAMDEIVDALHQKGRKLRDEI
jgi:DNA-directed RNA polymerase subunit alpha